MTVIHVAAAVIHGIDGRILLARRPEDKHQGGLWEFPGGKVEADETVQQALARELKEELGIIVSDSRPLIQVRHDYPDKSVLLDVWSVTGFTGEPHGAEGQPLAWVELRELPNYSFPAANVPIVAAARLPAQYLISPADLDSNALYAGASRALAQGCRMLLLRAPDMFDVAYRDLALDIQGLCAGRAQLMLKGPLEWLGDFPAAGWHLSSSQLRKYAASGRPFPKQRWLAASCHNAEELALARQIEADFITLSPVLPTASHPGAPALGWEQTQTLLQQCNIPVYLLGGMTPADSSRAWAIGAQGVAGIRAFWP